MQRSKEVRRTRKATNRSTAEQIQSIKAQYVTNYQSSEAAVKIFLDKLINLSIRQSETNRINNELSNYFFQYIKNQVEPIFEESYINYTRSTKDNTNSNILFWKNAKPTENEWVEIMEPETVREDRFEGAFALLKEIPKTKKSKMDKIKEGTQNENIKESEKEEDKDKNFNRMNKSRKTTKRLIEIKEEKKIPTQPETSNNAAAKPKNKKIQMIDFPSEDIPGYEEEYNYEIYDPPNIEKLRKEKEHEILKKEREIKMHQELLRMAKKKEEEEKLKQNKKEKPLDTNKFTFDSNGTIIQFKQYKLDNLTKDFTFVKNSVKSESNKSNKKKKQSSVKQQEVIPEEAVIKNPVDEERKEKEKSPIKIMAERNQEKIIPSGSNFQIILPNIGVVIKENQNKKEGGREFNKYFNKYSIHDYETILNEYVPLQNKTKVNFQPEKLTLSPTHSNIQKKMSSSVDKSSAKKAVTSENNMSSNNKLINYNYTITENINNNNNPLLNTTDNLNNLNNTNSNEIDNNNFSSSYLRSTIGINSYNKNTSNYNPLLTSSNMRSAFLNYGKDKTGPNFNDSITMSKAGMTSLKMELESLKDLRNDRTYYGPGNLKQKNILGSFMRNTRLTINREPVTNSLTNLNKDILTDGNWGNQIGGGKKDQNENVIYSRHHTKQQVLRELGSNILSGIKVRLPRDRRVELNK